MRETTMRLMVLLSVVSVVGCATQQEVSTTGTNGVPHARGYAVELVTRRADVGTVCREVCPAVADGGTEELMYCGPNLHEAYGATGFCLYRVSDR